MARAGRRPYEIGLRTEYTVISVSRDRHAAAGRMTTPSGLYFQTSVLLPNAWGDEERPGGRLDSLCSARQFPAWLEHFAWGFAHFDDASLNFHWGSEQSAWGT